MRDDLDYLIIGALTLIVLLVAGVFAFTIFHHEPSIPQAPVQRIECPVHMHVVYLEYDPLSYLCERNK